ncbi:MAG: hypothetical protein V4510_03615 [bacterium]
MADGTTLPPELQSLVPLFTRNKDKTHRTLVEFYAADLKTITELKNDLDLSWKDFFHAIAVLLRTLQTNKAAIETVTDLLHPEGKE